MGCGPGRGDRLPGIFAGSCAGTIFPVPAIDDGSGITPVTDPPQHHKPGPAPHTRGLQTLTSLQYPDAHIYFSETDLHRLAEIKAEIRHQLEKFRIGYSTPEFEYR